MELTGRAACLCGIDGRADVLDVRVHLDLPPELLPHDDVLVTIDLDDLAIEEVDVMPEAPRDFGDAWLRTQRTPALRVPSAIVPESQNILLNPEHPDAGRTRAAGCRRFMFDGRLWHGS